MINNASADKVGIIIRLLATFVDLLIMSVLLNLLFSFFTGKFFNEKLEILGTSIYVVYLMITPIIWNGHILGKFLFKIKIVKLNNTNLSFYDMFMREFIGKFLLGFLTFGISTIISLIMISVREDKRAIHDFLSKTMVLYKD